jgi:subfamily B ATP-binding cassette protein MsbA
MNTYLRILKYAQPIQWLAPQFLIYSILHVVFSIINFTVLLPLMRVLFGTVKPMEASLPDFSLSVKYIEQLFNYYFYTAINDYGSFRALYLICIIVVASTILSNLFKYLSLLILTLLRINVTKNLRNAFFNTLLNHDLKFFSSSRRGDVISRGTSDILEIEASVVATFTIFIKDPLLIFGYFFILFRMSTELTLYTLILLPVAGVVISQIVKRLKKRTRVLQDTLGSIGSILDESIGGMRVIKAFAAENYMSQKFKENVRLYSRKGFSVAKSFHLAPSVSEIFGATTLAAIMLIGGRMIFNNESILSAEEFILFITLFSQILAPAKSISNGLSNINKGIASGDRVFELMDKEQSITDREKGVDVSGLDKGIEFKNVFFGYEERDVLHDITFSIPKGNIVALVGPSGGGKSTIADLIPRFYEPRKGQILFDGHDLQSFNISSLRRLMGIVTQESILFHDTVFNNIAFGKENAKLEEVVEAAKIANAHEFIEELDLGYQTIIGERGTKLSGGQRQRLSIARAVMKNPPILILDEATSALDSESEKLVQEAIYNLMQNRTTLVIAHRLSTIQNADEILVIEDGKIVQKGSHQKLTEEGGLYKKLIDMQSF